MTRQQTIWNRFVTSTGFLCLCASFMLMSAGVQAVRADAGDESNMSIDPALEAALAEPEEGPEKLAPVVPAEDKEAAARPGIAGVETQPGVIVLNTRGYNYGARPGALDPAALTYEGAAQK
jgi:hypothetical protein